MGTIKSYQCINLNMSTQENYAHLNVDISPELDQYMNCETKAETIGETFKKKKTIKVDKGDFIRIKADIFFDEYELKEKLGEGGYSCVYKVLQRKTNYLRAVKAIKKKNVDKNEFLNEIEVLKTVDHPNIIKLFDCYFDRNFYLYGRRILQWGRFV